MAFPRATQTSLRKNPNSTLKYAAKVLTVKECLKTTKNPKNNKKTFHSLIFEKNPANNEKTH